MRSVSPLMGSVLVGLLSLNGFAVLAMMRGWDRLGASGSTIARESRSGDGAWYPPSIGGGQGYRAKPLAAFAQTLARPIFSRSRRPYVAPVASPSAVAAVEPVMAAAPVAEPVVTLAAVAINGQTSRALLVSKSHPAGRWMSPGDQVEDWTISTIAADRLTLAIGGRTMTVRLYAETGAADLLQH